MLGTLIVYDGVFVVATDDMPTAIVPSPTPIATSAPNALPGTIHDLGVGIPKPNVPEMVLTAGQQYIEQLVEPDARNILIVASDPSAWNFDTILILSISESDQSLRMINFPRDIYIDYSAWVKTTLEKTNPGLIREAGMMKINAAHAIGDKIKYKEGTGRFAKSYIDFLADLMDEVFDIPVDDFIYVRNNGFRRIVDYFGGVSLTVPIAMNYEDLVQDLFIHLEKGYQHLNGEQAEGFVRFRQGYDIDGNLISYGDIFRKENQTTFVKAFLKQHLTLANLAKIGPISEYIGSNMITSIKDWDQIVDYGAAAEKMVQQAYPMVGIELKTTITSIHGVSYMKMETKSP